MSSNYFSPTTTSTGAALFVSSNSKDQATFLRLKKQVSWDVNKKQGSFQGGKEIFVKLTQDEVGGILQAIRTTSQTSFYHSFNGTVTTGSFKYFEKDIEKGKKKGFGLTLKQGEDEWKVGFTLGSAERFSEYLKFVLDRAFQADYAADKKASEEYLKNKGKTVSKKTEKTEKTEEKVEPEKVEPEKEEVIESVASDTDNW